MITNQMVYSNPKGELISNNVWGKAKLISFLITQKHEESINKEINDFMEDFEKKKQWKLAAEWKATLPYSARRDLLQATT